MTNQNQDFASLITDVIPLRSSGYQRFKPQQSRNKENFTYARLAATQTMATTAIQVNLALVMVDAEQRLCFQRSGINSHVLQKLHAGHLKPSLTIDLHGRTVKQGHTDILLALDEARREGDRCILIIHGKGSGYRDRDGMRQGPTQPVLKSYVNYWLQQMSQVQAFCSAQLRDGGNGAVYVLLKKLSCGV